MVLTSLAAGGMEQLNFVTAVTAFLSYFTKGLLENHSSPQKGSLVATLHPRTATTVTASNVLMTAALA